MAKILRFPRRPRDEEQRSLFPDFPLRRGGSDARPSAPPPTDAEPLPLEERLAADDPGAQRLRLVRRGSLIAACSVVFLVGCGVAVFADGGFVDGRKHREIYEALSQEVEAQRDKVAELRKEVERLKTDPLAIERLAREELNYAAPGEIVILLPPEPEPGRPAGKLLFPPRKEKVERSVPPQGRD